MARPLRAKSLHQEARSDEGLPFPPPPSVLRPLPSVFSPPPFPVSRSAFRVSRFPSPFPLACLLLLLLCGCRSENGQEAEEKAAEATRLGADAQDDSNAGRIGQLLPTTSELQLRAWSRGWFKKEPVRVLPLEQLDRIWLQPELLASFNIGKVVTAVYQLNTSIGGEVISVDLVQADSCEDAYGLFSVHAWGRARGPRGPAALYAVRQPEPDVLEGYLWKGNVFGRFGTLISARRAGSLLAETVASRVRQAGPTPELVRLLPRRSLIPELVCYTRRATSLPRRGPQAVPCPDAGVLDEVLALGPKTELVVAAYEGAESGKNFVWVARYPFPDQAKAAYERYEAYKSSPQGRKDAVTLRTTIDVPQFRCLIGSWTAEEESETPIIPSLRDIFK